jgi:hypothetical protein
MHGSVPRNALLLLISCSLGACNQAPDGVVPTISPAQPSTLDDLTLELEGGGDSDGDPVTTSVTWFLDGDAQGEHRDATTISASATTKGQVWKAYVVPSDGALDGPASSVQVTILNSLPTATVTLSPSAPLTSEDVVANVSTEDADEDTVSLGYAWFRNGEATEHQDATLPAAATSRGEVWTVQVVPNDGEADGEVAISDALNIENTAPVIETVALEPQEAYETDTFVATATAADVDDDTVSLHYTWLVDDVVVLEGVDETELSGEQFDKHQQVAVRVTPHDGFIDGEALVSAAVTVRNSPPSITGVLLSPTEIYEESEVSCLPQGWADADGDDPVYTFVWEVDGYVVSKAATLTGALFDEDQTVKCTATPDDGEETGTAFTSAVATVLNTPPVLASVTLSTTSPVEGDVLNAMLGAITDVDGDSTSVSYAWFVAGAQVSTASSLDSSLFDKHQEIFVEVTPNDGDEDGDMVRSGIATALNSPPEITSLDLSPSAPYTDDVISTAVVTTDADGDEVVLSYAWSVDGAAISETGATLDGASWFDKDQGVELAVTPSDGEDDGVTQSASVVVANSPPGAPVVYITPTVPDGYTDALLCSLASEASDADGDALVHAASWLLDGAPWSGATETTALPGDTVPAGTCVGGELWTCQVTANDGEDDGPAGEDEVTIEGAYMQDDFTVDYGWNLGSSTGFAIQNGQLEWSMTVGVPEIISYEIAPLEGGFVMDFDLEVDAMNEHSSIYGLWLGLRESLSSEYGVSFGFSGCFTSCDSHGWRMSACYDTPSSGGCYGPYYLQLDEPYHVTLTFDGNVGELRTYDSSGALVVEAPMGLSGGGYPFVFRYLSLSAGGVMGSGNICCDGSGVIDNLELRAWED